MKEKHRSTALKKEEFAYRKVSYNEFMTSKEKDFVAFLFERANKKKDRTSPDFYTQERVQMPELRKKERTPEEILFEGVLGMAIRKSTKKSLATSQNKESSGIYIKKLMARSKIEEVYDLINRKEMFIEETQAKDATEEIFAKIKEIGEDLFNLEKGIHLLDRLLFHEEQKKEYAKLVVSILMGRMRYIYYTQEMCDLISKLIPVLKESLDVIRPIGPEKLADVFVSNTAGVVIGHILMVIFKKEDPDLFLGMCAQMPKVFTETSIARLFAKIPHAILWRLLAVSSRKMPSPGINELKKRLTSQIESGLKSRSSSVIENIRTFLKRCS